MEENITQSPSNPVTVNSQIAPDPWQLESLIRAAWKRTLDRFVSYFLAVVLSAVIFVAVAVISVVVAGIFFAISFALSLPNLGLVWILLIVLVTLLAYLVLLYVGSLINLLINDVIIQGNKIGVMETLVKVRPLVWDFAWFSFLMSLFMGGLFIWGFLSLFIIFILWSVWGAFVIFVFLEKRNNGLTNLWISRAMVSQRFWGIVGRMILVNMAVFLISSLLAGSKNSVMGLGSVLFSLISQLFLISFSYEMYCNIQVPQDVKRSGAWVGLSIAGYIITVVMVVVVGSSLAKSFKDFTPQYLMNVYKVLSNGQDITRFLPSNLTLPGGTGAGQAF